MRHSLIAIAIAACAISGCNIVDMSSRPSALVQQTPVYTGSNPNPWYLFQESMSIGDWLGGFGEYTGGGASYGNIAIDFNNSEFPHSGTKNIKFSYTAPLPSGSWAGGTFTHTPDFTAFASTPGRNISSMGFTKCTFYAASPTNAQVSFEAQTLAVVSPAPIGGYNTLTPNYVKYTINLPSPGTQTTVKDFFGLAIDFTHDGSASNTVIYIDDLRYEP